MYTELRSPNVHEPKTIGEYAETVINYNGSINSLWAGGTYIMSRPNFYPSPATNVEIINLKDIEELYRIQRNDRFSEIGAMVSLNDIALLGSNIFPKTLLQAIESTACRLIRERISVGGTLCTQGFNSSVSSVLILLDTAVEIIIPKKRNFTRRWVHGSRLYDKNGKFVLNTVFSNAMVSKIRIVIQNFDFEYFKTAGEPIKNPSEAVSLAVVSKLDQNGVSSPRLIITFPSIGFVYSKDIDNLLANLPLPANENRTRDLYRNILGYIKENLGPISKIQQVRLRGMLKDMVLSLNQHILSL
ncbi:MAG: FAD binding domain-containing protein [Sphaerochaetaceae bacterium]|nr:FAD binding domain-containing protein [Sphaerochaetaceae bacterium]